MNVILRIHFRVQKITLNTKGNTYAYLGSNATFWTLSSITNNLELILCSFNSFSYFSQLFLFFSSYFPRIFFFSFLSLSLFFLFFAVPHSRLWHTHISRIIPPHLFSAMQWSKGIHLWVMLLLCFKNKGMGGPTLG